MKKILILGLILFIASFGICFASDSDDEDYKYPTTGVLCSRNKKRCTVGNHVIRTNGRRPLYIRDGIVCTPNRRSCTNGFSRMHSNKPLY